MFVFKLLSRPWTFSAIGNGGTSIPGAGRGGGAGQNLGWPGEGGSQQGSPGPNTGLRLEHFQG